MILYKRRYDIGRGSLLPSPDKPLNSDTVVGNRINLDFEIENGSELVNTTNLAQPPSPSGEAVIIAQMPDAKANLTPLCRQH